MMDHELTEGHERKRNIQKIPCEKVKDFDMIPVGGPYVGDLSR